MWMPKLRQIGSGGCASSFFFPPRMPNISIDSQSTFITITVLALPTSNFRGILLCFPSPFCLFLLSVLVRSHTFLIGLERGREPSKNDNFLFWLTSQQFPSQYICCTSFHSMRPASAQFLWASPQRRHGNQRSLLLEHCWELLRN